MTRYSDLKVSVSTIYRVLHTGKASARTLDAMYALSSLMDWE